MTCRCVACIESRNRGVHLGPGPTGRKPCLGCGHLACAGRCNDCLTCQLSDPRPGGHVAT